MEHGAKECVEEQSRRETTIAVGVQSAAYIDTEITATNTKEEPGLVELVKSGPGLLVKEEVVEDGWQDMDRQRCLQATSTPAIATSMNVGIGGVVQDDGLNIKEEWADSDMDIGPTVLQPMDTPYRPVQPDVSIIKQEGRNEDDNINPTRCSGVKVETIEDERRETHICHKCNKNFPSKAYLHKHTSYVHSEQQYECAVCEKICRSKKPLNKHVYSVHRPRPAADMDDQRSNKAAQSKRRAPSQLYGCDECGKTYASKYTLLVHNKNLHSTESHACTKCKKIFPSKDYLYKHTIDAHSEQQHECAVCKKICRSKVALNQHVYNIHRPKPAGSKPRIYTCDYCKKMFTDKGTIRGHIARLHSSGSYKCHQCNKNFKCKKYLMRHKTTLHIARPKARIYTCDYCKKMFTEKATMQIHIAHMHLSESYKCDQCNKIFKCKDYLMRHNTRVHTARPKARIYTCDYCKKMFTEKATIGGHIAHMHLRESYKCDQCNKIFKCKDYLMRHKTNMHTARLQIHTCEYCQKTFRHKSSLKRHTENIHVAAHVHRWQRCNKNFKCNDELQRHNTSIHAYYKCELCLKFYKTIYNLGRHFKKAHHSKDIQFQSDLHPHAMPDLRLTADVTNAAASTSKQQHNVDVVKEEPADAELELGPVVFQHMDCNYRPYEEEPQDGSGD